MILLNDYTTVTHTFIVAITSFCLSFPRSEFLLSSTLLK